VNLAARDVSRHSARVTLARAIDSLRALAQSSSSAKLISGQSSPETAHALVESSLSLIAVVSRDRDVGIGVRVSLSSTEAVSGLREKVGGASGA